ncbi:hypothetical protein EHQ53_07810 [Leptospira langatensis]|uniref:Uncharacterized protein n=1 Tax=Leptospira langatensis TaxID=2484983 RepID=A0A5F1ZWZ2_9LEPT|nr:hypothetical protein [Leptospira langatensis]TGK01455.1 hypothetical protein EHO57_11060 [Leptospira langatensis]TGL42095.1 hypothetical protein EHQ53_07810 [Leptospira langatensis]
MQRSGWEKFACWSFVSLTIYISFYLTFTHYAGEAFLLSLLVTHLGIFTAFRRVLDRTYYIILTFSHIAICYVVGKNSLEILSAIDGWKQGF